MNKTQAFAEKSMELLLEIKKIENERRNDSNDMLFDALKEKATFHTIKINRIITAKNRLKTLSSFEPVTFISVLRITDLLEAVLNCNSNRDSRADHGVVAHSEEAHHLNVSGNGRGTCELSV